jgi:hypothetical protein
MGGLISEADSSNLGANGLVHPIDRVNNITAKQLMTLIVPALQFTPAGNIR